MTARPAADTSSTRVEPDLDLDAVRARFPALRRTVDGRTVAYFDGPGGTQVPDSVADAVRDYLLHHNGNAGWSYPTSLETTAIMAAGRDAMADFMGARPAEIAFGANMTTLVLRLSRALGRTLEPGDRVVVTELDHHANVDPWKALAAERGAEIRTVRMDPETGTLDPDDLAEAVDGAKILAIGAASNALGTMPDVRAAADLAREAGATVCVDAVHYAPHALVDVEALGADFVAVSPYKFYGPHAGVLWGREDRIRALDLPRVESASDRAPERLETGTLSFEAVAGVTAAVDFLASLGGPAGTERGAESGPAAGPDPTAGDRSRRARLSRAYQAMHRHGETVFRRLWEGLQGVDGVRLFGLPPGDRRTPTLGFAVDGVDPADATRRLAADGLFVTHGDFYATTVIRRLGFAGPGILRAGCVAYTTAEEVDRLVEGVRGLRRPG